VEAALLVMIGPPGSGKTTWVERRFADTQRVSLDMYRGLLTDDEGNLIATPSAVDLMHRILAYRCMLQLTTVVDATNAHAGHREGVLDHARLHRMLTVAVVMDLPVDLCIQQDAMRRRRVPSGEIKRIAADIAESVPPTGPVPGFDVTRRITLDGDWWYGDLPDLAATTSWAE
jgi:predicted kinase